MTTCKEAIRIMSSGERTSFAQWVKLKLHLIECEFCASFAKHMKILTQAFRGLMAIKTKVEVNEIYQLESEILDRLNVKSRSHL